VLVLALLIVGPKRLPAAGRSLGQGLREFRTSLTDPSISMVTALAIRHKTSQRVKAARWRRSLERLSR
jgi:TatA/E family protein of Tat protein translocase